MLPRSLLHFVVPATLIAIGVAGCSGADVGAPASAPPGLPGVTSSAAAQPSTTKSDEPNVSDYQRLLLTAADISDDEDTFTARSEVAQPSGIPGASAFFVNEEDNRAISDTLLIYPDAATASATLQQARARLGESVQGGTPAPISVGTDGVVIKGNSPEQDKAVTLVYFTEGRALVRLEFQSAVGDPTTDRFVTNVGKMQQIALRAGLDSAE